MDNQGDLMRVMLSVMALDTIRMGKPCTDCHTMHRLLPVRREKK
jgi:hypothetical protein